MESLSAVEGRQLTLSAGVFFVFLSQVTFLLHPLFWIRFKNHQRHSGGTIIMPNDTKPNTATLMVPMLLVPSTNGTHNGVINIVNPASIMNNNNNNSNNLSTVNTNVSNNNTSSGKKGKKRREANRAYPLPCESGTPDRKYECNYGCGKKFQSTYHLKRHESVHTGEKKYSCHECDYKCYQANHLDRHRIRMHTKAFHYYCPTCNQGFIGPGELDRHIEKQNHG